MGRGKRGEFFLGYKCHCGGDWNSEMPVAYVVASANENEKRHFKTIATEAKQRFPRARLHVGDPQYRQVWKTVFCGSDEGVTGGLGPSAAWSI